MATVTPPANGQALQAYIESARLDLAGLTAVDYYGLPLPVPLDEKLRLLANAFTALSPARRDAFMGALSPAERGLFGLFGHRAATLAVRGQDGDWLRLGLVGAAIANYDIPPRRDVTRSLAVFHHCARQLGLEPPALFDEAADYASEPMASILRDFGRRTDVVLQSFGWREVRTPDGVGFKFDWR